MKRYTEEYIEQLLAKFMEGTSSIEEEDALGEYFRSQECRPEWEEYRRMFAYFDNGMKTIPPAEEVPHPSNSRQRYVWIALTAVASIAVLCVMLFSSAPTRQAERLTAQTETPAPKAPTVREIDKQQVETTVEEAQKAIEHSPEKSFTKTKKRRINKAESTPAKATEHLMEPEETPNNIEEIMQEDLHRQLTEIERIDNEIAEYNSKRIMAEIDAYEIANDVREENLSGGDVSDQTPHLIRCLRAVTMQ